MKYQAGNKPYIGDNRNYKTSGIIQGLNAKGSILACSLGNLGLNIAQDKFLSERRLRNFVVLERSKKLKIIIIIARVFTMD